jgi:prolyl oligopeptidase
MLRYHKFTIGFKWSSEYGRSDVHGGFDFLIKYSAMLVTSGDHDDRVVPLHTYKFVASL